MAQVLRESIDDIIGTLSLRFLRLGFYEKPHNRGARWWADQASTQSDPLVSRHCRQESLHWHYRHHGRQQGRR